MVEEIAVENGRICKFKGLVTLTLTLDRVILHTIVHHSWPSTYMPNFIEIKETFRTEGRTDGQAFVTGFIRSTLRQSRPKNRAAQQKRSGQKSAKVVRAEEMKLRRG